MKEGDICVSSSARKREAKSMTTSLPSLLYQRCTGKSRSHVFRDEIAVQKSELELLDDPRVASPHTGAVSALQVDNQEGRFLLSGSGDATVCIYDLSKWGTEQCLKGSTSLSSSDEGSVYRPVARSVRVPFGDEHGHSHSVVQVQWYPVDTGAFLSASAEGSILVWDTHAMEPVIRWNPLSSISCMNLSTSQGRSESLLAVGSFDDESVRLLDIRSGAASHSLVGHEEGITCVQWSPASDVIVASGSLDGTVRLYDIRKPGSRSCLAVLDRDQPVNSTKNRPFRSSYSHLASPFKDEASPNNYGNSKSNSVVSHGGAVSSLCFTIDGTSLVSTGTDGKLQNWDLAIGSGHVLPLNFSSRANQPAVDRNQTRIPLVLQECGKETLAWVGYGSQVLGYSLQRGGQPTQVLDGHMHVVTSLERVNHSMQLFSGARDGLILAWGTPSEATRRRKRRSGSAEDQRKRIRETTNGDVDSW